MGLWFPYPWYIKPIEIPRRDWTIWIGSNILLIWDDASAHARPCTHQSMQWQLSTELRKLEVLLILFENVQAKTKLIRLGPRIRYHWWRIVSTFLTRICSSLLELIHVVHRLVNIHRDWTAKFSTFSQYQNARIDDYQSMSNTNQHSHPKQFQEKLTKIKTWAVHFLLLWFTWTDTAVILNHTSASNIVMAYFMYFQKLADLAALSKFSNWTSASLQLMWW